MGIVDQVKQQKSGGIVSQVQQRNNVAAAPTSGGGFLSRVKAGIGGIASGVGGIALTAEDYLGRKAINAFGSSRMKENIAKAPSLNEQFKQTMGGTEHPNIYGAGQLGGEIAALAAPVGAIGRVAKVGTEALLGAKLATKAPLVGKLAQAGAEGLAFTAGQGLTENKHESITDYAVNAGLNVAFPLGGAALNKAVGNMPARVINSLIKPLAKEFSYGKNPGESVAKLGIVANTFEELISKIRTVKNDIGAKIGEVISRTNIPEKIDLQATLKPIDDAIAAANKTPRTNQALINRLEAVKADLLGNMKDPSLLGAQELKGLVGDLTKWTGSVTDDQAVNKALKGVYGTIRSKMDDALSKVLSPAEFSRYKELTEHYGNLISADNAATYRDVLMQRQNLISFGAKNAGILSALTSMAFYGISPITALAGLGGIVIDKAAATPAFKTRLASLLSKLGPKEVTTFFEKVPTAKTLFTEDQIKGFFKRVAETPNKQGGFARIPGKVDSATKKEMIDAIDYIRLRKPFSQSMEEIIGHLTERYGVSAKSLPGVANKLEDLLGSTGQRFEDLKSRIPFEPSDAIKKSYAQKTIQDYSEAADFDKLARSMAQKGGRIEVPQSIKEMGEDAIAEFNSLVRYFKSRIK